MHFRGERRSKLAVVPPSVVELGYFHFRLPEKGFRAHLLHVHTGVRDSYPRLAHLQERPEKRCDKFPLREVKEPSYSTEIKFASLRMDALLHLRQRHWHYHLPGALDKATKLPYRECL